MNIDKIKKLVKILNKNNYKDVFAAIIMYEKLDYLQDLIDVNQSDIDDLEDIYKKFMKSDCKSLLNDDINDIIESEEV